MILSLQEGKEQLNEPVDDIPFLDFIREFNENFNHTTQQPEKADDNQSMFVNTGDNMCRIEHNWSNESKNRIRRRKWK